MMLVHFLILFLDKLKGIPMIKNQSVIEIKVGEKVYQFHCSLDSPLGEIHDILHQMKSYVLKKMIEFEQKENEKESK